MKLIHLASVVCVVALFTGCGSRAVGVDHDGATTNGQDGNLNNNSNNPCENGTCDGCCDGDFNCLPGTAHDQCGLAGRECVDCATLGGTCQNGSCVGTDPCGPNNCPGCCTTEGSCLAGTTSSACGIGGAQCIDCGRIDCIDGYCCDDQDGDGYGAGCPLGDDCDDNAPGIVGTCQADGCPQGWVYVPAGTFTAGCNPEGPFDGCEASELEEEEKFLEAFCIELTEVSVADFRSCQDHGLCSNPPPQHPGFICNWSEDRVSDRLDHPINCVPWLDARAYCQGWFNGDLPTEYQWEKAARGTDVRPFPWGYETPRDCNRCNWAWCLGGNQETFTWPVGFNTGTEGDSPYGVKDMCGNVAEMTRSCRNGHQPPLEECSLDPDLLETVVTRGEGGDQPAEPLPNTVYTYTAFYRGILALPPQQDDGLEWLGFRCIREM